AWVRPMDSLATVPAPTASTPGASGWGSTGHSGTIVDTPHAEPTRRMTSPWTGRPAPIGSTTAFPLSWAARVTCCFLLAWTLAALPAAARNRSDLKWQTLTTKHFKVHFHQGTEETARRAAEIAEEIYPAVTGLYEFEPKPPTNLIIKDGT